MPALRSPVWKIPAMLLRSAKHPLQRPPIQSEHQPCRLAGKQSLRERALPARRYLPACRFPSLFAQTYRRFCRLRHFHQKQNNCYRRVQAAQSPLNREEKACSSGGDHLRLHSRSAIPSLVRPPAWNYIKAFESPILIVTAYQNASGSVSLTPAERSVDQTMLFYCSTLKLSGGRSPSA